jgi:hypothetical protein
MYAGILATPEELAKQNKEVLQIKKETVHKLVFWYISSFEADLPFLLVLYHTLSNLSRGF